MRNAIFGVAIVSLACAQFVPVAHADMADASCEVRKDGDKQKGKSGPCTFSQRQGYIDIDLKNGDTISLSPAGDANQYKDQHHNKVKRVSSSSRTMEFKWEGDKHVTVTFNGNSYGGGYGNSYDDDYNQHNGGAHGGYRIENIGNGDFEVIWNNPKCIADYDRHGNSTGYTNCNPDMKRRSDEIARNRAR